MAVDPRRRARQQARKAAKRKAQVAAKRKHGSGGPGWSQFAFVPGLPLHECLMPEGIFQTGIGNVVISRRTGETVYAGVFLADVFCLGVKDAFLSALTRSEFDDLIDRFRGQAQMISIHPACARKLVEGAAAYAQDLGFSPHKDYRKAKVVFGDIDPAVCPQSFEFGRQGKPCFISGPYDSMTRCEKIIATLRSRCGPDGFHFQMGMGSNDLGEEEYEDEGGLGT